MHRKLVGLSPRGGAPDAAAIREVLADIWTTITTGRDNTISAREKGDFSGPRNLARSLARHRVLHFRDPDHAIDELIADDILALGETGRRGGTRPPGAPPPTEEFTVAGAPRPAWRETGAAPPRGGSRTRSRVRASADYAAAKAGDLDAAERVVDQLVRPEKVEALRAQLGGQDAVIVPVIAREAAGENKLPLVYAGRLAQALGRHFVDLSALPGTTGMRTIGFVARVTNDEPRLLPYFGAHR